MKQIPGTIIVTFHRGVGEADINSYLQEEHLEGTLVSQFRNRYAIEVPAGREDEYVERFSNEELIESVNPHYLRGMKERPRRKKDEDGEKGN